MNDTVIHGLLNQNDFGIIDVSMVEHLPKGLPVERIVPQNLMQHAHLMPLMVDLRGATSAQRQGLFSCLSETPASEQPAVALFAKTNVNAVSFTHHWNSIQLATPEPDRKLWLRLHDTRVLHQLLRILTPSQQRKLFGMIDGITYWVGNEWLTAARPAFRHGDNGITNHSSPMQTWDWDRIEQIGIVNRALQAAHVQGAAALISEGQRVERLIRRAKAKHRLTEQADLIAFASRGLTVCDAFDEHPVVAQAIRSRPDVDEESLLSDRFALVAGQVWEELRRRYT